MKGVLQRVVSVERHRRFARKIIYRLRCGHFVVFDERVHMPAARAVATMTCYRCERKG